ncbi:DNA-binding transcriptional repressor MngR [Enterobacter cloacae]|nr:DNA-binding transcriptional repressor MngR [Enterobacter cloacae]
MPSDEAIAALALDPAKPILEKVSRGFLKDGRVFEYSRNVFNTDDYKFTLVAKRRQ